MTAPIVPPRDAKRKWYGLAQRHRRMAERLRRAGFADGTAFHAYHAFECTMSALIAARNLPVPTSHGRRLALFAQVADPAKPYAATFARLFALTVQARNDALYYDEGTGQLPTDKASTTTVAGLLPLVHRFAREAWREIR